MNIIPPLIERMSPGYYKEYPQYPRSRHTASPTVSMVILPVLELLYTSVLLLSVVKGRRVLAGVEGGGGGGWETMGGGVSPKKPKLV